MKTFAIWLVSVSCCLSAAPAVAEKGNAPLTVTGTRPDPASIRVPYGDLSLANAVDARLLRARVERATKRACGTLYDDTTPYQRWACRDIARDAAEPQIAAAIERARAGQNMAGREVVLRFARR